jgi:pimeloyl-ACP methyl ester carboxylesterase
MPATAPIDVSPARLAGERAGRGEPVLLLHGIGTSRGDFTALAGRLAAEHDVLALDLPGHGGSPPLDRPQTPAAIADAVASELGARGLGTVHVVGNSLGGRIALELARHGRARSVVALAPSGVALPHERMYQAALMARARVELGALRPAIPALARTPAGRTALLAPLRARPWAADEREALALRGGFAGAERFWDALWWNVLLDVPEGLDAIRCPVTLVQGGLDAVAPGQAPRYLALIPGARLVALPFAGHAPQADSPDEVARIVRATIRRAGEGRPGRQRVGVRTSWTTQPLPSGSAKPRNEP